MSELATEFSDAGLTPFCGEWVDVAGEPMRCIRRAEFILWGKLIPAEGLGPRCYDHAAKHIGHSGLTRPGKSGWAVADLRPIWRVIAAFSTTTTAERSSPEVGPSGGSSDG